MGVINITPDSFSDGGRLGTPAAAVDDALRMMDAGADLIDVGGESTRPGAAPVGADEELERVLPVIEALAKRGVPLSVDTTKAEVAEQAIRSGALIVNDISGLTFDEGMRHAVAAAGVPLVVMHTRGSPQTMQEGEIAYEGGVVTAVKQALAMSIQLAIQAGIGETEIIVDPGIGFGKTVAQNLELLRRLSELRELGCPVLVGTSRKSFIGKLTGKPVSERSHGTAATVALAIAGGADLVRVHDVPEMLDVVAVADAIVR